ncbi:MAG TPA: hypothetical protein VF256_10390, partial [Streptosporangiaceae bacterium]
AQRPSVTAPPRAPDQMISRVFRAGWRPLMMPGITGSSVTDSHPRKVMSARALRRYFYVPLV